MQKCTFLVVSVGKRAEGIIYKICLPLCTEPFEARPQRKEPLVSSLCSSVPLEELTLTRLIFMIFRTWYLC
jgi:hypothetical protein